MVRSRPGDGASEGHRSPGARAVEHPHAPVLTAFSMARRAGDADARVGVEDGVASVVAAYVGEGHRECWAFGDDLQRGGLAQLHDGETRGRERDGDGLAARLLGAVEGEAGHRGVGNVGRLDPKELRQGRHARVAHGNHCVAVARGRLGDVDRNHRLRELGGRVRRERTRGVNAHRRRDDRAVTGPAASEAAALAAASVAAGRGRHHRQHPALVQKEDVPRRRRDGAPRERRAQAVHLRRGGRRGRRHGAGRVDCEDLRRAETCNEELRPLDDDVAEVSVDRQRARRRTAGGGEAHELPGCARDMNEIGRGIVGDAARGTADRATPKKRARRDVEGDEGPSTAKRHVDPARRVLHQAPRLIARHQRELRDEGGMEDVGDGDHRDEVAVGIRGDRGREVFGDQQRSAADGRRGYRLRDGRPEGDVRPLEGRGLRPPAWAEVAWRAGEDEGMAARPAPRRLLRCTPRARERTRKLRKQRDPRRLRAWSLLDGNSGWRRRHWVAFRLPVQDPRSRRHRDLHGL